MSRNNTSNNTDHNIIFQVSECALNNAPNSITVYTQLFHSYSYITADVLCIYDKVIYYVISQIAVVEY